MKITLLKQWFPEQPLHCRGDQTSNFNIDNMKTIKIT